MSMETAILIVGILGNVLTVIANIPQTIKTIRSKKTDDLSLLWLFFLIIMLIVWVIYGALLNQIPMIIGNSIAIVLILSIFYVKISNELKKKEINKQIRKDKRNKGD